MKRTLRWAGVFWLLLFAFAFVAAPHSCEWGLSAYTWVGLLGLPAFGLAAFLERTEEHAARRALRGAGLMAGTIAVWSAGLFAANVRIMCRLF